MSEWTSRCPVHTQADYDAAARAREGSGLDIEAVLDRHRTWSNNRKPATYLRWTCSCGAELDDDFSGVNVGARHRAHVAAVLREQIATWLGSDDAEESVYQALDPGGYGWAAGDSPSVRETIRTLAALVAPSRVPEEGS